MSKLDTDVTLTVSVARDDQTVRRALSMAEHYGRCAKLYQQLSQTWEQFGNDMDLWALADSLGTAHAIAAGTSAGNNPPENEGTPGAGTAEGQ